MLPRIEEDEPMHPTRRPVPTRRQLLRHRWEMASTLDEFPAFADTMRLLLREVAAAWDVAPLPGYPAFGNRGASRSFQAPADVTTPAEGRRGRICRMFRPSCSS